MTNEELLKTEQSVEPVPLLGIFATEIPAYLKGSVCRLMDAARKDEAIRFGNLLKKFASIEGVKRELLWWDKMTGGTFYTTEQLYELFKKEK